MSSRRINGHRAQEVTELLRAACIKGAVCPLCQSRNLFECMLGSGITAFLKQEYRDVVNAEFTGRPAEFVDVFFHAVADKKPVH